MYVSLRTEETEVVPYEKIILPRRGGYVSIPSPPSVAMNKVNPGERTPHVKENRKDKKRNRFVMPCGSGEFSRHLG